MSESVTQFKAEGGVDKLVMRKFFPNATSGKVFVDIGAAKPDYLSVSALYRSNGWRVIAVEPNPEFCEMYKTRGYEVHQYACGDHDEDDVDFLIVNSHGKQYEDGQVTNESFSSLAIKDSYAKFSQDLDITKIKINLRRLDTILKQHAPEIEHFDILSVDVEGWELEVLDGLSVSVYRPSVMIIENLFNERKYRSHLRNLNYCLWKRIPPNDVYVRNDLFPSRLQRAFLRLYEIRVGMRKK